MSGSNDTTDSYPTNAPPQKYYWPWECTYYWPWQWRIRWQWPSHRPRFRFSLLALMALVTGAAFCANWLGLAYRRVEGKNLSATEANHRLEIVGCWCRVPEGTTAVDLHANSRWAFISFDMPFADFARYCNGRGWHLRLIDPKWPKEVCDRPGRFVTIKHGYYYQGTTHRGGYDAYYDMDQRRAWIDHSHN